MDFRDSLFDAIASIMQADPSVMVITNDMSAMKLDAMRKEWPERILNVGIAEQNMMSVAAGLAQTGRRIFGFGIGAHLACRAWEQIKLDICAPKLPVVLIGVGGGLAYGSDGPTHHATEDVALMLTLPEMAIYNPCDPVCTILSVHHAYERHAPAYIRLDRENVTPLYAPDQDISAGFAIFRDGADVTLLSTGIMTFRAIEAAGRLRTQGVSVRVTDVSRLKPFAGSSWAEAIGAPKHVFTLEEHNISNAFGSQAAVYLAGAGGPRLTVLGLPDAFLFGSASRTWAHDRFGLTAASIADRIFSVMSR
jgi:transketolase